MPLPAASGGRLFIVADGGKVIVARDRPVVEGDAEQTALGSIVELKLIPHVVTVSRDPDVNESRASTVKAQAPGMSRVITVTFIAALTAAIEAIFVGSWLTPLVSVPAAAVIAWYAFSRHMRRVRALENKWRDNHRTLSRYEDTQALNDALMAIKQIMDVWPQLGELLDISDPSPTLARSLWDLTELLANRATMRGKQHELEQAKIALPADLRVKDEIDDRLAQIKTSLSQLNTNITQRSQCFQKIADECQQFVREQQAIARAREAVRGADQALGSVVSPSPDSLDRNEELSSRTRNVLAAYRDLTKHLSCDGTTNG